MVQTYCAFAAFYRPSNCLGASLDGPGNKKLAQGWALKWSKCTIGLHICKIVFFLSEQLHGRCAHSKNWLCTPTEQLLMFVVSMSSPTMHLLSFLYIRIHYQWKWWSLTSFIDNVCEFDTHGWAHRQVHWTTISILKLNKCTVGVNN